MRKARAIGIIGALLAVIVLVLALTGSGVAAICVGVLAAAAMFEAARRMRGLSDA